MKSDLRHKLLQLEDLIKIQRNCLEPGYMHGMMNGLVCAHSVISCSTPEYVTMDRQYTKIRHKLRKKHK